ncbi:DMT family transporter [Fodinibius sediminis]|uniref:Threonine/homoserine efflux transporter RhtA n=1 Tax=Fodinibius sediminis TaxID=1214077 RepID=A0A521CJM7_9BACT|nr:DMT family transporter [Fodinibius sediminis]SMO59646.1 Threonine/homoserine efflux transporter RhtA [Fodinibius sediminis]
MNFSKKSLVEFSLLAVAFIWALNFSVIKSALSEIDPLSFNGLRFIFAAAAVWIVLLYRGQLFTIPPEDWLPLLGMGLLGNLVYQGLFIIGIDYTYAANAAVMLGTIPIWVALFSHLFNLERMNLTKAMGVVLAFGGIVFIMAGGNESLSIDSDSLLGDLVIIAAAIVWGGFTLLSKSFLDRYTPIQFSAIMATIGSIVLFLIGLPNILTLEWSSISKAAYGGVFYSGFLSIGIAFVIWNYGLQTVGAVHTATYQNLVPVLGLGFGVVLLNEHLTLLQYGGSALVIAGIVLARWKKRKKAEAVV